SENTILNDIKLDQILDFDKGNLTLTVQAGALLESVREEVESANQFLWVAGLGTIGGVIATKASVQPMLRDLILGMRILLPTGEVVKLGAKTMKNVAGYEVPKLLIGSWGLLGLILDVTFRLFPYPAKELAAQKTKPFVMTDISGKSNPPLIHGIWRPACPT
ncbi:MAG: FAD-binding oxidoreductase, partial [Elusimicrobia bacterium]|nr:FAD-binding oxidoreductase [Candidatus Obscuribacterium magneticum]